MRSRLVVNLVAAALLTASCALPPAQAQGFTQVAFATFTTNVTLTTTSETVIVSSAPATLPREGASVCVLAWAQLTTGGMTTTVTPRIRRGTSTSGTLVGEANAETLTGATGDTHGYTIMECETLTSVTAQDYSLTLQQASANANGTALHGGILVFAK